MKASFAFIHEGGLLTEWSFGGYNRWDGFWQDYCTLVEAKGRYDWIDRIKNGEGIWESVVKRICQTTKKSKNKSSLRKRQLTGGKEIKLEWHLKRDKNLQDFYKAY